MHFEGQDQTSDNFEKLEKVIQKSTAWNKKKQVLCVPFMKEETNTKIYKKRYNWLPEACQEKTRELEKIKN